MSERLEMDMTLLAELYEDIDRNPPGIETRKVLVEQYIDANWTDSAIGAIEELRKLSPDDAQVRQWHAMFCEASSGASTKSPATINVAIIQDTRQPFRSSGAVSGAQNTVAPAMGHSQSRFAVFRSNAASALKGLALVSKSRPGKGNPKTKSSVANTQAPVADLVKRMKSSPDGAAEIAMSEFENLASGLKEHGQNEDDIRDQITKRVQAAFSALPASLQTYPQIALMHLDHEVFHKKYVNTETMYGDDVADIPRVTFLATEDGYAWDMEELQRAIISGKGVMRNPLSKNMFTPADVQAILQHPLGKELGALQVEQKMLRKGVRPQTINEMDRVSAILLDDMADDAMGSRKAVDEFVAYIATLPAHEQSALENLRVPARDSHTGQAFDGSISDTIRAAKGNQICFHKAGESLIFLSLSGVLHVCNDRRTFKILLVC
jgi:hypothetical protein